jgi:hypothetical protein
MSFVEHIQRVLEMPKVTAHLLTLPPISVEGHDVKSLTQEVQEKWLKVWLNYIKKYLSQKVNYIKPSSGSHERSFMPAFCHHFISGSFL